MTGMCPLVVKLSQVRVQITVGIPRLFPTLKYSGSFEYLRFVGVASMRSGANASISDLMAPDTGRELSMSPAILNKELD